MTLFETKYSPITQCLKIFKKISFKIASEASYVYLLSGQKLLKNAKKWPIFENPRLEQNSVTRHVKINWTNMIETVKIEKLKCDILGEFQTQ